MTNGTAVDEALVEAVRQGLAELADLTKASGMRAYMKSAMPYRGVQTPALRRLCGEVFDAHPLPDRAAWQDTVLALWRMAEHREERYAAVELTGWWAYRGHQDPAALPLYHELVVTGAWWDHVDVVAARRVGPIRRGHPTEVTPVVLEWARSPDRWLRRTAVLCQLGAKDATDRDLLAAVLEPNLEDPDFFLRKAIGWALRDLARTDAGWVRRYVTDREDRLSPLSRREALKNVGR